MPTSEVRLIPELREVARFGVRQLDADALVIVDERPRPAVVVAREGAAAADLLAELEILVGSDGVVDGSGVVLRRFGHRTLISVLADYHGRGGPSATVHVLQGARRSPVGDEQVLALARQVGLVLERVGADDPWGASRAEDPLEALDALPSRADAVSRLTATVADVLRPRFGIPVACLIVWDGERSILRALPGSFGTSDPALSDSISGPRTNPSSLTGRVFATGQPYIVNHASTDPSILRKYVDVFGLHRVMAAPLTIGARTAGVLLLANKPDPFTVRDLLDLERLTPRIATVVELTLSIDKIRRAQRMERVLARTATEVVSGKSLSACLTSGLRALGEVTGSSIAAFSPRREPALVWRGHPVEERLESDFLQAARAMGTLAAGEFPHEAGDPGWAAAHAPVMLAGERIAAVSMMRQNALPFGNDEEESLSRLADLAALAWASERYEHQLSELTRSRERARIADDLHDHVAQIMFAAQLGLDSLLERDGRAPSEVHEILEIRGLLTKGECAVRTVIEGCTPAPHTDLVRRLRQTVDAVEEQFHAASVTLDLPVSEDICDVSRPVADCVVRVAHEAIVNAAKHAGPCQITLRLTVAIDLLCLEVNDDGVGPGEDGFCERYGLASIRRAVTEVGAQLHLGAGPGGRGTHVSLALPRRLSDGEVTSRLHPSALDLQRV